MRKKYMYTILCNLQQQPKNQNQMKKLKTPKPTNSSRLTLKRTCNIILKICVVAYDCNPRAQEAEAPWVRQLRLPVEIPHYHASFTWVLRVLHACLTLYPWSHLPSLSFLW